MPAQERNTQHPGSSPEVSRLSAAARKKLGTLGVSLDRLARALDTAPLADSLWVAMLACACMCGHLVLLYCKCKANIDLLVRLQCVYVSPCYSM
jgi:hypothetical protein